MCNKIDILVKNKPTVKYFKNGKYYKNNTKLNIHHINDFGLSINDFDEILKDSHKSNSINIVSPTYMSLLLLKRGYLSLDNRFYLEKLIYNSAINLEIIGKYIPTDDISRFIIKNNKDYMFKYLMDYKRYNTCYIYEGTSGYNEVDSAFEDWVNNTKNINQVLIGGMALVNYDIERSTQDVDFIFLSQDDIPDSVYGFKKHRNNAFQHNKTHVEIEVLTNNSINLEKEVVDIIFKTAYQKDKFKVASPSGIVAIKLDRFSNSDEKDIYSLMKNYSINIDEYLPFLSQKAINNWKSINI
jgi:hypothetical protein